MKDYRAVYNALMKFYPLTLGDLNGEQWRDVDDYDGLYQVSNFGRVKSFHNNNEMIIKPQYSHCGYLRIGLCKPGERAKKFFIHRLVAESFIANIEGKPQINHVDGCKFNNYVGNLEWATRQENMRHADRTGLRKMPKGANCSYAKLTNEQALYIRNNPDNLTQRQMAEKFGVGKPTVSMIQRGKIWAHLGGTIRGENQRGLPRVPDETRYQIKIDYATVQYSQQQLADKYGYSRSTIGRIVNEE